MQHSSATRQRNAVASVDTLDRPQQVAGDGSADAGKEPTETLDRRTADRRGGPGADQKNDSDYRQRAQRQRAEFQSLAAPNKAVFIALKRVVRCLDELANGTGELKRRTVYGTHVSHPLLYIPA